MTAIAIWPVLAGLGLFLFGLYMLEEAIKHLAGRPFKMFLRKHTNNSVKAVLAGVLFTTVLQSSSMAALLVMSFAGAGIIGLKNGIGIILGANLGTTVTGWLVSLIGFKLNLGEAILPFLAVGGLGIIFLKSERLSNLSKLLMGFSFMFLGLDYMKNGFENFATTLDFSVLEGKPMILFTLFGLALTAAIQSSSAAIMIFLSSVAAGMVSIEQSFFLVVGADLGTTVTAMIGTLNANSIRKKVGWSQVSFNVFNAAIALVFMVFYQKAVFAIVGDDDPLIALVVFHSFLNLVGILLLLPFLAPFSRFIDRRFASQVAHSAKHLALVNPAESQSAIAALSNESTAFTERAIVVCKKLFTPEAKSSPFNSSYLKLKAYEAEVVTFYQTLQKVPLTEDEVRRINTLVAATRNATLAAKYLKDIRHNLDTLAMAASDQFFSFFSEISRQQIQFYAELTELMRQKTPLTEGDVNRLRTNTAYSYEVRLAEVYALFADKPQRELDLSSMMNLMRGMASSNEALLRAITNLKAST
jgi:phosphate:Na+ symporter